MRSRYTVSEVVGDVTNAGMAEYIKAACAKKNKAVTVEEVGLASLSSQDRAGTLSENGTFETAARGRPQDHC